MRDEARTETEEGKVTCITASKGEPEKMEDRALCSTRPGPLLSSGLWHAGAAIPSTRINRRSSPALTSVMSEYAVVRTSKLQLKGQKR